MKEFGTKREVAKKIAMKTKKGATYESLIAEEKRYASLAKRSISAQNSPWRKHVMDYAKKRKISYSTALADPNCKKGYTPVVKVKKQKEKPPVEEVDTSE